MMGVTFVAAVWGQKRNTRLLNESTCTGKSPFGDVSLRGPKHAKVRMGLSGLVFDCDGVLADTERDGHRVSFNRAFEERGINENWSEERYGKLLEVGGGKERMTAHWNEVGWPEEYGDENARKELVIALHKRKTELFMGMISSGDMALRPGVVKLIDEAIEAKVPLAVCSTSNEKAVSGIVDTLIGAERSPSIPVFAGDMARKKKPAPDVYNLATEHFGWDPSEVVVVEDSFIGLSAAKAAGMQCIVTKSTYTVDEDFSAADLITDDLVSGNVSLASLRNLVQ